MKMRYLFCFTTAILLVFISTIQTQAEECVVLLHGLARSDGSMDEMEESLQKADFTVVNHDYPSTDYPIEELSTVA